MHILKASTPSRGGLRGWRTLLLCTYCYIVLSTALYIFSITAAITVSRTGLQVTIHAGCAIVYCHESRVGNAIVVHKHRATLREWLEGLWFRSYGFSDRSWTWVPLWTVAVPGLLAAMTARYLPPRLRSASQCRGCGYDVTGVVTKVCPECGLSRVSD